MRRTIAGIGRTLVALGLLILLFVTYQLWGTGIWTARAQDRLEKEFEQALAGDDPVVQGVPTTTGVAPTTGSTSTTSTTRPALGPAPIEEGNWAGKIIIPKMGVDKIFVEGTDAEELRQGPGHYPATPFPGEVGNAAIAGHRTTYGAPFGDLDKLKEGDEIEIRMVHGTFVYRVYQAHLIVGKRDVWVVDPTEDAQLTLTSCHPKGSAEQRIVVKAKLVKERSAKPRKAKPRPVGTTAADDQDALEQGLAGTHKSLTPTIAWGVVALLVGLAWWWAFRRWRHPLTWIIGLIPFLAVLAPFYFFLERALPAGY